jgi:hypothetical protein
MRMAKAKSSKLDPHAERLTEWFLAGKTLAEARELLRQAGCAVSLSRLSVWWESRQAARAEEALLRRITSGAEQVRTVERAFGENPAPELATIIKLHRVLAMQFATAGSSSPALLEVSERATRMALEFAKLEEKRAARELAEQKYRDLVAERKRAIEAELGKARTGGGITPETLERIERELKLL